MEQVDSDIVLRSFRVKNGHVVSSVPTRRISQQEQLSTLSSSGSEGFIDQGKHEVFHHFMRPSEREEPYVAIEGDDQPDSGGGMRGSSSVHFNLPPTRQLSAEHSDVLSPGVVGGDGVEVITMEDEQDEEMRRFHAHKKWNERRRQIEAEFQRLRHFSIQQQRAGRMRHSVSFGDDLETQVVYGTEFVRTSSNGNKKRNFSAAPGGRIDPEGRGVGSPRMLARNSVAVMHQLERSHSMPMRQPNQEGYPGRRQPKLETYEEEEEDDDDDVFDDNIMMGLPPKDIPCRAMSNSDEHLPSLNMDDIPFTDVHDQTDLSGEEQDQEEAYASPTLSRRGSNHQERVPSIRERESIEDDQSSSGRHGQKTKRTQVRQELAKYYNQDSSASASGRRTSGNDRRGSS